MIQELAETLGLPPENLVTPDYIRQICWQPPQVITPDSIANALAAFGARQWQIGLVSEAVASALIAAEPVEDD